METKEEGAPLRIRALRVENYKRISAVELQADGKSIVLGGRNAQGKSSLLDAIADALGGKRRGSGSPMPLRTGSLKGEVVVDLGEYIVKRTWSPTGDRLTVEDPKGATFKSPQTLLDKLLGDISFDPLAFLRFDDKRQAETLRAMVGIDTVELDNKRAGIYANRTNVNRQLATAQTMLAACVLGAEPDAPADPPSVQELLTARDQGRERAQQLKWALEEPDRLNGELAQLADQCAELDDLIDARRGQAKAAELVIKACSDALAATVLAGALDAALGAAIDRLKAAADDGLRIGHAARDVAAGEAVEADDMKRELTSKVAALQVRVAQCAEQQPANQAEAESVRAKVAAIEGSLRDADEVRKAIDVARVARRDWEAAKAARLERRGEVDRLQAEADGLTAAIAGLDLQRGAMMAAAAFPVEGLAVDGDFITFRGLPLSQASQAERLRVCIAIGAALHPRLAIALVREGAFLDDDGLREVVTAVEAAGLQAWVEVVGDRDGVGVIIEDGRIEDGSVTTARRAARKEPAK